MEALTPRRNSGGKFDRIQVFYFWTDESGGLYPGCFRSTAVKLVQDALKSQKAGFFGKSSLPTAYRRINLVSWYILANNWSNSIFGIKSLFFCRIFPGDRFRVFFAAPLSKLRLNFPLADRSCVNFEPAGEFRLGKRDFGFCRSLGLSNGEQIWFFLLCFFPIYGRLLNSYCRIRCFALIDSGSYLKIIQNSALFRHFKIRGKLRGSFVEILLNLFSGEFCIHRQIQSRNSPLIFLDQLVENRV